MTNYEVRFESTGFSDNMSVADNCLSEKDLLTLNQRLPIGILQVIDVHASADDGQEDSDIHTFISVTVLADNSNPPLDAAMILFLDRAVETLIAGDGEGEIHMDHFSWEQVESDPVGIEKIAA